MVSVQDRFLEEALYMQAWVIQKVVYRQALCMCFEFQINRKRFPGGSDGKESPAMKKIQVQSLGWEDPLEKGNGNPLQYSCLGNPRRGKPGRLQSMRSKRVGHNWATNTKQKANTGEMGGTFLPLLQGVHGHVSALRKQGMQAGCEGLKMSSLTCIGRMHNTQGKMLSRGGNSRGTEETFDCYQ